MPKPTEILCPYYLSRNINTEPIAKMINPTTLIAADGHVIGATINPIPSSVSFIPIKYW